MAFHLNELLASQQGRNYSLHEQYLNTQMVRVLRTIGFDKIYEKGEGQYLYDQEGQRYLDLMSGYGVFGIGRNHPVVSQALIDAIQSKLPNLVQMDCALLAGILAKELLARAPQGIDKVFFSNSGTEAVEGAIKFARAATKRNKIVFCDHAFHGLTTGSLALNGDKIFREGFGPLLSDCEMIPYNDIEALDRVLSKRNVAAFFVEPIQGKGVNLPDAHYFAAVSSLCEKYETLLVIDEIQTGLGRTGTFLALEHWGIQPDMILIAKMLSGGFIPVGAILTKQWIFDRVFSRMDKAVVHGSTFGKNALAMVAGLATLSVIDDEKLIERSAVMGEKLINELKQLIDEFEFVKEVRGRGMMIGIEFGPPRSLKLKTAWKLLETASPSLFCQMITIPMLTQHRVISQVAGHNSFVVKLLPPFIITDDDIAWIVRGFREVIREAHRVPGAMWDLAKTLAGHAIKSKRSTSELFSS